jgi:ABC-type cobalamin/Fe3+-siderophores transport system ATPase subunit
MKFRFEKLGCIEKADIELGDLTILCGDNNAGKTYASYAIYGFLTAWDTNIVFKEKKLAKQLVKDGSAQFDLKTLEGRLSETMNALCKQYTGYLPVVFGLKPEHFADTVFSAPLQDYKPTYKRGMEISVGNAEEEVLKIHKKPDSSVLDFILLKKMKKDIPITLLEIPINRILGEAFLREYFPKPFMISAERIGISTFYKELEISKTVVMQSLLQQQEKLKLNEKMKNGNFMEMIRNTALQYPFPIQDGIDFICDIPDIYKKKSPLIQEHPELEKELKKISGGDYKVENDQVFFFFKKGRKTQKIQLCMGSSSVKSLSDLNLYIRHLAKEGDILMINEPELNLHPANQRRMARLLVRLIKAGIKVFVTTHSNYLIKELNNLIILGNGFKGKARIMKKYGYTDEDMLDRTKVKVYETEKNMLKPAPIGDLGIEVGSLDSEMNEINNMFFSMLRAAK